MAVTFTQLMTDCLVSLGDPSAGTWARVTIIWPWCIEAMMAFPILRPMQQGYTFIAGSVQHTCVLGADFREMISVEYPTGQNPPVYLTRRNRLDPNFFEDETHYDIDRNYATGSGWVLWLSRGMVGGEHLHINYLANHDTAMADDSTKVIRVPDEYENILIAYMVAKGYRERLGHYMQDPTAHTSIILQMTEMVNKAELNYQQLVLRAQEKLAGSRTPPSMQVDKFDRVY